MADLLSLLMLCFVVPATWICLLGWDRISAIPGHDGITQVYPMLRDLLEVNGDTSRLLYRLNMLGGIRMLDIGHALPLYRVYSLVGLSPLFALNATVFILQITYAFLALRIAQDLRVRWSPTATRSATSKNMAARYTLRVASAWLVAFAPVLAWRLYYGHFNLIVGTFVFLVAVALILAAGNRRLSYVLLVVCTLTMLTSVPSAGQQVILYGAVFGLPLLVALAWPQLRGLRDADAGNRRRALQAIGLVSLVFIGAIAIAMPWYSGLLENAFGGDGSRTLNGSPVVYSFLPSTMRDWLGSIPWQNELIATGREAGDWHETNYAFGPLIVLLALIPWRKSLSLAVTLAIGLLMVLAFSLNVEPFSGFMQLAVPTLKGFRVPQRAILPFALFIPSIAVAVLEMHAQHLASQKLRTQGMMILAAIVVTAGAILLPATARELLMWTAVVVFAVSFLFRRTALHATLIPLLAIALGGASVSAFRERELGYTPEEYLTSVPAQVRSQMVELEPSLVAPLTRAKFAVDVPPFHINAPFALGFSSLDGYWFPTRRFQNLVTALQLAPENPTATVFNFTEGYPDFEVLRQLYNSTRIIEVQSDTLASRSTGPTAGQAWFSASAAVVESRATLARELLGNRGNLASYVHERLLVQATDPQVTDEVMGALRSLPASCRQSRVDAVRYVDAPQTYSITLTNNAVCPLTVAMNYLSILHAEAILTDGARREVPVFPGYGPLASVLVPAGTREIVISAARPYPLWSIAFCAIGICLLCAAAWLLHREKQQTTLPESLRPLDLPPAARGAGAARTAAAGRSHAVA